MFNPSEILFATTTECNLQCKHCFVTRNNQKLDISKAKNLLADCINSSTTENLPQIESVGFTGGEPFLYVDFLTEISNFCVENELYFDSITTNGVFWNTEEELDNILTRLYESGYDGKIQISFDCFHNQDEVKIAVFIKQVLSIFNNSGMIKLLSVVNDDKQSQTMFLNKLTELSKILNAKIIHKSNSIILTSKDKEQEFYIQVIQFPQSYKATNSNAWQATKWFTEDYCEGPGNILYVHSDGNIAPCCGFANENKELFIGTINDSYSAIIKNAKENRLIQTCYTTGLEDLRKKLQKDNHSFPGKTNDICTFCDYVCTKKLIN